MANIIDDSLSELQAIDPEHILDLSEVGEEEIDTLSEAIREVIVGVSSINGMTGDVILTAADLNAYTKAEVDDTFVKKEDIVEDIMITVTYDVQTETAHWSGADSVEDVKNAFDAGATITVFAPPFATDEYFRIGWARMVVPGQLDLLTIDDDPGIHKLSISDNENRARLYPIELQRKLTAGNNITISNEDVISANVDLSGYATKQDITVSLGGDTYDTSQEFADSLMSAIGNAFDDVHNSIGDIQELIPEQATASNKLADKNFVNSSVQTATANFRGNWTDWADVPTVATDYPADYAGSTTPTVNDYLAVQDASDYPLETLEGTWRFKYTGDWDVDGKAGWQPEYQVNETPLTAAQLAALNSGITAGLVANIPTAPNIVITLGVDGGGNMVWSGADSISDVRNAFNNGGSLRVEAPLLTEEIYNITEVWWKDSNHDRLIVQSVDNDAALIQIGIADDYSVEMDNVNLQERLQAGANITINGNVISASVPTITVDTGLDNTSTNPVQNQALYDAIVGKEIIFPVYASAWSEPFGTQPYTTNAIVTLPAGSFTDNCTIELMIDDKFNDFAKYGFVLYGAETASQRIWLTALDKPTQTIYLKIKVYTYGN